MRENSPSSSEVSDDEELKTAESKSGDKFTAEEREFTENYSESHGKTR